MCPSLGEMKFLTDCMQNSSWSITAGMRASSPALSTRPSHALEHNVEFMVELVGKKSRFGVDQFLRQVKGETNFSDLLQPYDVNAEPAPTDATARQLDELFQATKRALAAARPRLEVTAAVEADSFNLSLEWARAPRWPNHDSRSSCVADHPASGASAATQ